MLYGNSHYYSYHAQRQHQAAKEVDIYILNQKEFLTMWIYTQKDLGKSPAQIEEKLSRLTGVELISSTLDVAKDHAALTRDIALLSVLARDLMRSGGLLTEYYTTVRNGQEYIVFKGNHRLRRIIRGTRYLASNTQMLKLGIGGKGIRAAAKTSFVITAVMSLTLRTYEWFFKEEYRWAHWVSNLSADLIKLAIAGFSGYLAATGVIALGAATAVAVPVVIPIVAGISSLFLLGFL
ncbi:hypothetical protein [Marinimicrobium alkaliphilum]|uniref:hypothetical protein n=1 Tax=Marinimicrobium alkaliphilum TaxID=2202654 RepID=UPI000DBA96A6|nr:hypothetical protein [Marinimicrobium alkaliphilum]